MGRCCGWCVRMAGRFGVLISVCRLLDFRRVINFRTSNVHPPLLLPRSTTTNPLHTYPHSIPSLYLHARPVHVLRALHLRHAIQHQKSSSVRGPSGSRPIVSGPFQVAGCCPRHVSKWTRLLGAHVHAAWRPCMPLAAAAIKAVLRELYMK